jgi:hypothetical protein
MGTGYQSSEGDVQQDKPSSCSDKPGHVESGKIGHWNGIISKFLTTIRSHVPLGYEDETGFHTGRMSPENKHTQCGR